jgi:hypothetical protein
VLRRIGDDQKAAAESVGRRIIGRKVEDAIRQQLQAGQGILKVAKIVEPTFPEWSPTTGRFSQSPQSPLRAHRRRTKQGPATHLHEILGQQVSPDHANPVAGQQSHVPASAMK